MPKITNEVTLKHNLINPRTSLWHTLYENNPDNYWCKVFIDRMSSATKDEIDMMIHYGVRLEEILVKTVGKIDSITSDEQHEILISIVRHLEFFHIMNEHFFDTIIELCERAEEFDKQLPWIDMMILSNPVFLSQNPLVCILSKRYNATMYTTLVANKEEILGGKFSVLR